MQIISSPGRYVLLPGTICGGRNQLRPTRAFVVRKIRYDVTDILSVTRHMVSHYVNSHISTQHRASELLLLELFFIREGVLSCPLLSADDIDMFVDFICISCLQCFDAVGWAAGRASGL